MKLTKETLKQIIKEEMDVVLQQEGFMDSVKGAFGIDQEPAPTSRFSNNYMYGAHLPKPDGNSQLVVAMVRHPESLADVASDKAQFYLFGAEGVSPEGLSELERVLGLEGRLSLGQEKLNTADEDRFYEIFKPLNL
jgi:hypothetical protein